ncbi:MAG: helix-turn-helix transcriptional regulator [Nitrosopumilaceae archaeon]
MNDNKDFFEKTSSEFLELASEIRMKILYEILVKKSRVTLMAKKLGVTAQEVHRNFDRMTNAGLLEQVKDGSYQITPYGKAICYQIPSIAFLSKNKEYFEKHSFGDLPPKFIRRIGDLNESEYIHGVSRVLEKWKSIYKNADEYIFTLLAETPLDLLELMVKRVKKGVRYRHIISENAVIPKGRKKLLRQIGFYPLLELGKIERRMLKDVKVMIIMNEAEGAAMFSSIDGRPDLGGMFWSDNKNFHEWCIDYFRYCWNLSDPFKEFKLKE